ncbi:unnamed protein product [Peronospora effusa]|nr:unnamed protein product [Peronospora effusa]
MRSLSTSIDVGPIPEHIKVATFMNGLRHGSSRQDRFRKVPATMEEAIDIALLKEQSYNSASATAYYRPSSERSDATPMELGNADVICYKCGKRGHMMARCYAKVDAGAKAATSLPEGSRECDDEPEPVVVDGGLTRSQAPQEPAQSHEPERAPDLLQKIKGTSKRVTLGSVSVQEDGPTTELFEVVEDKMPDASSVEVLQLFLASAEEIVNLSEMTWDLFLYELKEGKIHEIVAPVPEEKVVDCCSSSTMDESVLETDKKKRFAV